MASNLKSLCRRDREKQDLSVRICRSSVLILEIDFELNLDLYMFSSQILEMIGWELVLTCAHFMLEPVAFSLFLFEYPQN